jgi:hypothetical protein
MGVQINKFKCTGKETDTNICENNSNNCDGYPLRAQYFCVKRKRRQALVCTELLIGVTYPGQTFASESFTDGVTLKTG